MIPRYNNFRFLLSRLHSGFHETVNHMLAGSINGVRWIDVESFYNALFKASHGMPALQTAVDKARLDISSDYNKRVTEPIVRLIPIVHTMEKYSSQSWMIDELVRKFGADHEGLGPDFGIGAAVLELLNEVKGYDQMIKNFQASFETWQQQLPVEITRLKYYPPPLRTAEFEQIRHAVARGLQSLAELSGDPAQQTGSPAGTAGSSIKERSRGRREKKARRCFLGHLLSFFQV